MKNNNDFDINKIIGDSYSVSQEKNRAGADFINKSHKDRLRDREKELFPQRLKERFKTLQGRNYAPCKSQEALGREFYEKYQPNKETVSNPDQQIRAWLNGKNMPTDKKIKCLAEILDCYPDYLLGYIPEANEREYPEHYSTREEYEISRRENASAFHSAMHIELILKRFGYLCNHYLNDNSIHVESMCSVTVAHPESLEYIITQEKHEDFIKDVQSYLDFLILKYSSPDEYWKDDPPVLLH